MADRRGRSRTRIKSKYNVNDPRNWTKAKLRSKLQDLGKQTPPKFSRTDLVDLYLKQNESSRPALSEQTTVTTETESTLTADGAHGTPTQTGHPVLMAQDTEAHSFMDGMKTESTLPQRTNRKRRITATATARTKRPAPSLFNRMHPEVKTAKYTDDSTTDFPTVKILKKNYTAVIGEQVKLECSISGTPQITTVSWQRIFPDGQTVTLGIDEIKYTGSKLNDPHLVINDIKKTDEGDYVFTISSVNGERKSARTKLKVNGGPPTLNMKPKIHHKTEGDIAILKCNVIAEPPATNLTWTKNEEGCEKPIAIDNDKYHGGLLQSPSLIIDETEKCYDEGKYTCEAENHAGQGSNSVHLTIEKKYENTETDETTQNEGITQRIVFRHAQMVNALSKFIYPKANYWAQFKELAKAYVPNSELGEKVHDIISYLRQMEYISYGKYTKLFQIVNEIDKEAARIIKKTEADIKTIKKGGRTTETTAVLECKFEGNYNPNLPQTCTSQIKEQYRDVDGRIKGSGDEGSIVLKFTISEAQTPLQPSSLYLAVTLKTRLESRKIVLKDESNKPLVLQTTPKVTIPTDNPKDIPTARLSRGQYRFTEGKYVILKCVVVATADTESIQWFMVKDGNPHAICIDNKKYFGGLSNSPSLAIADVQKSDRGIYFCKAKNSAGEAESDIAFVEIKSIGDLDTRTADSIAEKRRVFTAKERISTLKHKVKKKVSSLMVDTGCVMEDTGCVMEDPDGVMKDTGGVMEDTGGVMEDTGGVKEDTGGVMEDTSGLMKDTSDVKNLGTMKVDVVKKELSSGLEGNASTKDNESALEEDESSMKKDINVIKQERRRQFVSAVKTDSFTDQDTKTSMIDPYKANPEKLMEEQIANEHAKLVTELTEYVSPKLDTWSTFRKSLSWALPPPYVGENLDSIVNHLIKKQIIQFGQYQKLYDVVDQFDRKASIIIKKAEARIKAIQAKEDCSDGEDDISSIKEDIGSMKNDILAIKQDVAIIRQIVGTVKTESTTDKEHETGNMDEVSSMMKGVSSVKKELNVGTRSAIKGTCRLLAQKYNLRDDCVVPVTDASNQEDLIIIYDPSCNTERKLKEFGEDVMIRNPTFVSYEGAIVSDICKTKHYFVKPEDKLNLKKTINQHTKYLFASHSNLNIITTSPVKSRKKGADTIECPCIVLVCSSKGYIPVGETRFPKELICENTSFVVDVREGYCQFCPSSYSTFDGSFFHQNIKMGCSFGIEGTHNAGTIGPFVSDFQGHQLFLTCAHTVNGVDQNGYDLNFIQNMFAEQPDALKFPNPQSQGCIPQRCGQVRRALFLPNNPTSVDAAVVEITEQSRLPSRGEFAVDSELNLKAAGFDYVPRFESGEIHDNPDTLETDLRIVKFEARTHVTRGVISSLGTSVKPLTADLGIQGQTERCVMKNQYEVLSIGRHSDFFSPGDSGSGVFAVNKLPTGEPKLTCIGMAIGCTSYGSIIVTPIAAILDALGLPRKLKQFP